MPKNKGKELVYLGPEIGNSRVIFKPTEEQLEIGIVCKIEDGRDISSYDLISLEPCKKGPGYYMRYLYKGPAKGPAKISTEAYRSGWDRTFSLN